MAKTVDEYLSSHADWAPVLGPLHRVLQDSELEETVKWGAPVYTFDGHNVVGLLAFKSYAGLWFFDGALLDDPDGVLVNAQEGKTRGMRQWRFAAGDNVDEARIRHYVRAAIDNAKAGRRIEPKAAAPVELPPLLAETLAADDGLQTAFDRLTPGRQREYARFIAEAKREETRQRRLTKALPMIARGEGLHDRLRR